MKVYSPSHKRPDAPLFSISNNLIIVLQFPEELEEYRKINEPRSHTVVCIDTDKYEQELLGARNWILDQNDDWSMQIDDDCSEFYQLLYSQYLDCPWDAFIKETEKIINEIDSSKVGIIGYNRVPEFHNGRQKHQFYDSITNDYERAKDYKFWQCVVLNNKILKSKNFKYESNLFQKEDGTITHYGEDSFIQYWCEDNNLDKIVINKVTFGSLWNSGVNSICSDNKKQKKQQIKDCYIWLLNRFKNACLSSKILDEFNSYLLHEEIEVYVPSHKRSDSKLFEITHGLNIILQFEEDVEPYSKWKDRHNVIYIPELRGLLDARNWILENNNNWVLMMDDDITEFSENSEIMEWDKFLEETKNALLQMDISKIGIAGLTIYPNEKDYLNLGKYSVSKYFKIFQVIFLNCKLLNSIGYRYEGYPYDGFNGQRAYGEDWDILHYCYKNNILMAKINSLSFKVNHEQSTVCWENDKEIWSLLTQFWLLEKYKDNEATVKSILYNINKSLEKCEYEYGKDSYNKIMNKISYEILNKNEEDKEMKKFLIGGLVLSLLLGLNGCKQDVEPEEAKKVVDAKYIGEYWRKISNSRAEKLLVRETEIIFESNAMDIDVDIATYPGAEIYPAWTERKNLYVDEGLASPTRLGYFIDENTFTQDGIREYKKQ
jgi:hypothetical protein